jgi:hypothetical protein
MFCWTAYADTASSDKSLAQLKMWATDLPDPARQAAALMGIAWGLKLHTPKPTAEQAATTQNDSANYATTENRSATASKITTFSANQPVPKISVVCEVLRGNRENPHTRESFKQHINSTPEWWLEQAIALTEAVGTPRTQAYLWMRIAEVQEEIGRKADAEKTIQRAHQCVYDFLLGKGQGKNSSAPSYQSRQGFVPNQRDFQQMTTAIDILLDLETVHHLRGEKQESVDTLLDALSLAALLPRTAKSYRYFEAWSPQLWTAQIAGRLRLRGRADIAERILIPNYWNLNRPAPSRAQSYFLACIKSEDTRLILQQSETTQREGRGSLDFTWAAGGYAQLAILAGRQGNADQFQTYAMKAGGLVTQSSNRAPPAVYADLARGAACIGDFDLAREFVKKSQVFGLEKDQTVMEIVLEMVRHKKIGEARQLMAGIEDDVAKLRASYAVTRAEAAQSDFDFTNLVESFGERGGLAEQAAALAGVGGVMLPKLKSAAE